MTNTMKLPGLVEPEKFLSLGKEIMEYLKKLYNEELYTSYDWLYYNGDIDTYKGKVLALKDIPIMLMKDCVPLLGEWHLRKIIEQRHEICEMSSEPQGYWEFTIEGEDGERVIVKTGERDMLLAYLYLAGEIIHKELGLE